LAFAFFHLRARGERFGKLINNLNHLKKKLSQINDDQFTQEQKNQLIIKIQAAYRQLDHIYHPSNPLLAEQMKDKATTSTQNTVQAKRSIKETKELREYRRWKQLQETEPELGKQPTPTTP